MNPYLGAPVRSAGFSPSGGTGVPARERKAFVTERTEGAEDSAGGGVQSTGFSLLGGPSVCSAGFSPSACNPQSAICNPQSAKSAIPGEAIVDYPQSAESAIRNPQSAIEECRGGSDWLDESATEALLRRVGVLCHDPTYPVYEKQTFAYDGWRVIQEHKKAAYGTGIPLGTAIPVAQQFTYGNYLDEALTLDADTDSDGDCTDSGGSTRYYYHQNSLFSVAALSDASANYKEGYQYDPYGRHVRLTDGNDGDTYVNFNTNDTRSALATSAYGNPYLFTGQRLDSESGLYYYKNRYYSTSQGRFISRDPVGYEGGNNLYEYVRGAATAYMDPDGLRAAPGTGEPTCKWCPHPLPCPTHRDQSFPGPLPPPPGSPPGMTPPPDGRVPPVVPPPPPHDQRASVEDML